MKPFFLSSFRSGLLALGLTAGLSIPAMAVPPTAPSVPSANAAAPEFTPVRSGDRDWRRGNSGGRQFSGRNLSGRQFSGRNLNGRHYGGSRHVSRHYSHNRNWRRPNYHYRRHYRGGSGFYGSGAFLGFGLGVPAYNYYYNEPRRYYRTNRLSGAHVQWCYDRYRSYRAYDNTFQPYHGPRQQCYSPYS